MYCLPHPALRRLAILLLPLLLAACGGSDGERAAASGDNDRPTMRRLAVAGNPALARWSPLRSLPLVPAAMANLPDGKVLLWSAEQKFSFGVATGLTYFATYDPTTNTVSERTVTETGHNMFCPGTTNLADGRLLVNGGISASRTSLFDPVTGQWSTGASMNIPRGYHANTLLADGSVLTLGGSWSGGVGNKHGEVWTAAGGWRRLSGLPVDSMLSPDPSRNFGGDSHFWLIPTANGRVLYAGPGVNMQWIDTTGNGEVTSAGRRGDDEFSISGTTVMYEAGKILKTGGGPGYDSVNANANTYVIDTTAGLSVRKVAPMAYRRAFHNSVVLPNGQVVVIGGQTYAVAFTDNNSVLVPELWDPATETFTPLPPIAAPRNYHSVALLLPDGRVLSAGGGLCGAGCAANHPDLQILSPHYLFKPDGTPATRPVITSAPARVQYGQKVTVQTDSPVTAMAIVRLSSTTHTVNNDQRRLALDFRAIGANSYEVDVPSNPGLALPGDWMLFAMNADGTPSVAKIVRIVRDGAPSIAPVGDVNASTDGPMTLTPSVSVPAGSTVTYSATGLPAGLTIDSTTGRISGTPTTPGSATVTLTASTGSVRVSQVFRITVNAPGSSRYVRLEAVSEIGGNPWASAAEIGLLGRGGQPLLRQGWVATADSQETSSSNNAPAAHAIDGNPGTYWHTQWSTSAPGMPHWLTIDLGSGTDITGLTYLPRQDASTNGTIAGYRVYLSSDGVNWGAPVATGNLSELATGKAERTVYFRNLARGRPATQSSNLSATTGAGLAADGNTDGTFGNGSVSHTASEANPWWEVDLGSSQALHAIRLWNRTDCCANRLSNFYVFASDTPMTGRSLAQLLADASVWRSQFGGTAGRTVLIAPGGARGRHVRVQLAGTEALQLAEVEVHGTPAANRPPTIVTPPGLTSIQGDAASLAISATDPDNDLLTFSASGLPPGVTIAPGTGVISGTPTADGRYQVTVGVDDGRGGSTAAQFSWLVQPAAPQLLPVATAPGTAGTALALTADTAVPGSYSFQWSFGDGSAPTAWSVANSVSHTYSAPGVYQVTVTARTADGRSTSRVFWQAVQGPTGQAGRSSSQILVEPRSGAAARVWVVNPDNDSVSVFDTAQSTRLAEIPVGTRPRTLALAPDGRIWVANQGSASLSIVSPTSLAVVQTVAMGRASQPFGIVIAPDGSAYVTEEAGGRITRVSAAGVPGASASVGLNVRHLALNASGSHLLASRFITPPLPGEGTAVVQTSVNGVPRGAELLLVATGGMALQRTIVLRHSDKPDNTVQGRGIPNYLGAPVVSPDGRSIWVPSKQDNIRRGMLRDGQPLDFQNTVRAISSRIDIATLAEDMPARIDHDNAGLASAAAFHPGGAYLFVALETSRHVAVVDPVGQRELFRVDVGRAPQGLALSPDGLTLYVHNFMDRSVSVLDLTRLVNFGESALPVKATMATVGTDKLPTAVLRGKQLFHDARDPRLARDGYLSCAACHADGGHDGRTWDFTGFGEGLRNTTSLKGRAGGQGRLHWSGNFDEVQDFEGQIRTLAQGTGLMADALFNAGTRSQPLGDKKAGLSADLDALAAYLGSLNSFDPTPWRGAGGALSAAATAGRAVFALNCASCHGGNDFTNSADGQLRNVGTLKPASGQRLGAALTGIDPPTLRDAWATAPYLHDGSAATLEDAVRAHTTLTLTSAALANVSAFVREIGREEPAVAPQAVGSFRSSPVFGLGTGTAFTDPVFAGQALTGLAVRHWPAIYLIQGLTSTGNLPANGNASAGTPASVGLAANESLVRIYGRFDANGVTQLAFVTSTGRVLGPGGSDPTPATSTPFDFTVPAGSRIVGFTGRKGAQLTAIGVLYSP